MAKVISIINQKGGVGKTTTAINLSSYLAHFKQPTLLIDLDPQANASSGLGFSPNSVSLGLYEVLSAQTSFKEIIKRTKNNYLHLAPTNSNLAGAAVELVNADNREYRLKELIDTLRNDYSYIIIDSPPSLGLLTVNSLVASDYVLIPIQSEYYALEGLGQLLETINLVREHLQPKLDILGAVITMYDKRNKLSQAVMEELYKHFPYQIFRSIIPRSVKLAEAPSHGLSILDYMPKSKSALAYQNLAKEIIQLNK
jgi:chromosome partitioning protein